MDKKLKKIFKRKLYEIGTLLKRILKVNLFIQMIIPIRLLRLRIGSEIKFQKKNLNLSMRMY
ncbi:hypothetical protein C095_03175 [Fusobacterium necrophorum subsp. funduliforme B35]|uniref:Uncharacterized protein n=1 Tax=Fusobacterium necrophorum subsp. funduliforme B35 TaxID=1226633 RepID=A0A0B4EK33_9FUSO|nr:hypothetical protein C095_03175 [Fusobacterium necrophorum subsp. funduliforme B35]